MLARCLMSLCLALALAAPQLMRARAAAPLSHVYVIMMENTDYEDVIGNTTDAPYINQLANTYSFGANYYGVTHPSEPNYVAFAAGDFFGLHADDQSKRFPATNIVDQLESKGLTWATYQQGLPAVGSTVDQAPATGSGLYVRKHNPFALFTDVLASPTRVQNFKPIESLATDLNSGNAPNFAFIAPDQCHDMHGVSPPSSVNYGMPWCGYPPNFTLNHALIQAGDAYVKQLVTTIMSSKGWTTDSAIVLTWDENESSGLTTPNRGYASSTGCCASPIGEGGGRVPLVVITNTASHTVSLQPYNHYSLLRTIEDNFGLSCLANACDPSVHAMTDLISPSGSAIPLPFTQGFAVTFTSTVVGQGWVLFGPGPGCSGLVETATNDVSAGTKTHTVIVTGNDLAGSIGNIGLTPGTTYSYESVTLGTDGTTQVDDNGGQCYQVTISKPA
jgi:phosphatidylinositol-3-phosphatase